MDKKEFSEILEKDKKIIDASIKKFFSPSANKLDQAVYYAIDGGKRIRPIVFLETIRMIKGEEFSDKDINLAISIEMIHAYSLIHDDMPCMDNDDFRRGKETVHKKFGEPIGLLAGDYLLNTAYENIFTLASKDINFAKAGLYIAKNAGRSGMIEGQFYDIFKESSYDMSYLEKVYEKKTGGLFKACLGAAGLSLGLGKEDVLRLERYGKYLGLSFQLEDDLLDDQAEDELNILHVMTKDQARDYLHIFNKKAKDALENFDKKDFHIYLIDYLSRRTI